MKVLLFLLSLWVGFHLCSCDSYEITNELTAPRLPLPQPGSHYFVLALTWPNAFCKEEEVTCQPSPPKQYFTIHGFWPRKRYCNAPPLKDSTLKKYKEKLFQFWPNLRDARNFNSGKKFWHSQWRKHGSCSSNTFPQDSYFNKAITLGSTYGPRFDEAFKAAGIKPNGTAYSWIKITQAMKKVTGNKDGFLTCTNDTSKKLQLSEIRICFEFDAETIMNCNRPVVPLNCGNELVFASPPP